MQTLNYKVTPVRAALAPHLEKSLEAVPQVRSVHIDLDDSRVVIEHDGADADEILTVLREEGIERR